MSMPAVATDALGRSRPQALAGLVLLVAAWSGAASAGVAFSCTGPDGSITLTDQPCGRDARTKAYRTFDPVARPAAEAAGPRRRRPAGSPEAAAASPPVGRPVATTAAAAASLLPGVRPVAGGVSNRANQKVAICAALAEERGLAQKQIRGEAMPQAGESPTDNLALIERQWARVGCAGVSSSG